MELLSQVSNAQFLYPAAAVAVVLVCAALVFIFGFHSAEQPQFDKLPLVLDDRKSSNKKRKIKEKKSSPNRTVDDVRSKTESSKKSPVKEKKDEKQKELEKPKPKEKVAEHKLAKKEVAVAEVKKGKKKSAVEVEKPADFDEGVWEEVPKKSEKKKVKVTDEKDKKESPVKKSKKKNKDSDIEAAQIIEETIDEIVKVKVTVDTPLDEESNRALQAQVEEFQRVLKEAERRDQAAFGSTEEEDAVDDELSEVKDLRSNKKKENKEKQIKKKAVESVVVKSAPKVEDKDLSDSSDKQDNNQNAPAFDELGDTWTDTKVSKKSKKKARKDQ